MTTRVVQWATGTTGGTRGEYHTEMGCLASAMHAVHVVPTVRATSPGIIDLADAGEFLGRST